MVVVTATNAAGTDTATSAPSAVLPAPPANTTPPSISGTDELGSVLTADPGTWSGTGPLDMTYQWQRCDFFGNNCVDIVGATDDTYTLGTDDVGHTIKVVVTASNAAGSDSAGAPTSPAVTDPTPDPDPDARRPRRPRRPTPDARGNAEARDPGCRAATARPPARSSSGSAFGGLGGDGPRQRPRPPRQRRELPAAARQLQVPPRQGQGRRHGPLRAYAKGPATKDSPVRVTTQISRGKAKKVTYKLDGRKLKAKRKGKTLEGRDHAAEAAAVGIHKLVATVKGKKKKAKKVVTLKLKTVTCRTLFTAQRWRTTPAPACGCASTRARRCRASPSRSPGRCCRARSSEAARSASCACSSPARAAAAATRSSSRKKGKKTVLVAGAGKPTVKLGKGKITVTGLPARAAVAELTMYRLKKLDGAPKRRVFKLRARVAPTGTTLSVRTKRLR